MEEPERNQPNQNIRGGASRPSTLVNHSEVPALANRERVVKILLMHDLNEKNAALKQLEETDFETLRIIALEGAGANIEPSIRYSAIAALAFSRSSDNLNLLADLAQFGEDFYVRGHALLALGTTGLHMSIGIIVQHLEAKERFEQLSARRAIHLVAQRSSVDAVMAHVSLLEDANMRSSVRQILESAEVVQRQAAPQTTPLREKGQTSR